MPVTIQFYHLTATPLERALPKLLEKALAGGFRTLVVAESDAAVEKLDELLWTYDANSFLPHGSAKNHAAAQPILLSTELDPVNQAGLLLVTDGRTPDAPENFARILDIFDGRNEESVAKARTRWSHYKTGGHALTYLKQTESGGWQQPSAE